MDGAQIDRRAFKSPTEINQMNQINRMRFALFCDRAYRQAVVAAEVVHALVTIVEVEVERAAVVVVVRSRTPIVAAEATVVVER